MHAAHTCSISIHFMMFTFTTFRIFYRFCRLKNKGMIFGAYLLMIYATSAID